MPKQQTTAGQAARRDARTGAKYTVALRTRQARAVPPSGQPPVVRFLAEGCHDIHRMTGGIAAARARRGERVLLLEESDPYWRMTHLLKHWRQRKRPEAVPPQPTTSALWRCSRGSGLIDHHTCLWRQDPTQPDRTLLQDAVAAAGKDYDLILLIPDGSWSNPERSVAAVHIAIGVVHDFPHTDCRTVVPGTDEEHGIPLTPQQSAAVLRERCLSHLFGPFQPPVPVAGVVWRVRHEPPVDRGYLDRIDQDMRRVGLPTIAWSVIPDFVMEMDRLPTAAQLADPHFSQPYEQIADHLLDRISR